MKTEAILAMARKPELPQSSSTMKREKSTDDVADTQPKKVKKSATKDKDEQSLAATDAAATSGKAKSSKKPSLDAMKTLNIDDSSGHPAAVNVKKKKKSKVGAADSAPTKNAAFISKETHSGGGSSGTASSNIKSSSEAQKKVKMEGVEKEILSPKDSEGSSFSDSSSESDASDNEERHIIRARKVISGTHTFNLETHLLTHRPLLDDLTQRALLKKISKSLSTTWPPDWDDIEAEGRLLELDWIRNDLNSISDKAVREQTRFGLAAPHPAWAFDAIGKLASTLEKYNDVHTCKPSKQASARIRAEAGIKSISELVMWDHAGGTFAGGGGPDGNAGGGHGQGTSSGGQ